MKLTGGAMVGSRGGPLLLTPPTGLHPAVAEYLNHTSTSLHTTYLLGGTAALAQHLVGPIADNMGLGEFLIYDEIQFDTSASVPMLPNVKGQRRTHTR